MVATLVVASQKLAKKNKKLAHEVWKKMEFTVQSKKHTWSTFMKMWDRMKTTVPILFG
jgi:L-serine deaminase